MVKCSSGATGYGYYALSALILLESAKIPDFLRLPDSNASYYRVDIVFLQRPPQIRLITGLQGEFRIVNHTTLIVFDK